MADETAEQVLTQVLGEHWEYGPTADYDGWECGCGKRISTTSGGALDEDMQAHVAAELREALAVAWEEGYSASEFDARLLRECPGSSGCDCEVPTSNPYEEEGSA